MGYKKYMAGAFNYSDWCAHDAKIFRSLGLKQTDFQEICRDVQPSPHLQETLTVLKANNVRMAIVSGALDTVLHNVLPWSEDFFDDIHLNRVIYDAGGSLRDIIPTPYDFEGKLKCVEMLCEKYGIPASETAFIGDGINDLSVKGEVGLTIAFGSTCEEVKDAFDVDLPDDDFRAVLPYLIK